MTELARSTLERLIKERGESYSGLSQLLGRNPAYIQQFVKRGSPRRLEEQDRRTLASYFGIEEEELGGQPPAKGSPTLSIPQLCVRASAGSGNMVDREFVVGHFHFDRQWLQSVCQGKLENLAVIKVDGDSMSPTLDHGDDILIDQSDRISRLRDGIYVLRRDETLMVKRLSVAPASGMVTVSSDNPAYPTFHNCPLDSIAILGRVVWIGRKLT